MLKNCTKILWMFFLVILFFSMKNTVVAEFVFFDDVTEHNPAYDQIKTLKINGTVSGYDNNLFKPENKINRAEFLKIAMEYRMHRDLDDSNQNCFDDVSNQWYAKYVCGALELGLVKGYDDGTFKPEQDISFVEASKILVEIYKEYLKHDLNDYNESWFHPYVVVMEKQKAIPFSVTKFDHKITRGEMAIMTVRLHSYISPSDTKKLSSTYEALKSNSTFNNPNDGVNARQIFVNNFEATYKKKLSIAGVPQEVDIRSFTIPEDFFYRNMYNDKNNLYCYSSKQEKLVKINNADYSTLEVDPDMDFTYVNDKNYLYKRDPDLECYVPSKKIDEDKRKVFRNIYVDDKSVYYFRYDSDTRNYEFVEVPDSDGPTFKESVGELTVNKWNKYFEDKLIFMPMQITGKS